MQVQNSPDRRRIGWALLFAALFCAVPALSGSASAETAVACAPQAATVPAPDAVHGVRTKWRYVAGVDTRRSIEPDLMGLSLETWAQTLEKAGVNVIDLNLDPREKLRPGPEGPDTAAYVAALRIPHGERTAAQRRLVATYQDGIVARNLYSPADRDAVLLAFLADLEHLRATRRIAGSFQVVLHQRQWFRPGASPRAAAMRAQRIADFAADMGDFVVQARQRCLDHWIAGIRLGENANTDMNQYLPILVDIARQVNARSGGWLKSRMFVANGGGMGAEYKGIASSAFAAEFFPAIAQETRYFAFGYKWMQFTDNQRRFIARNMQEASCGLFRRCAVDDRGDWVTFLDDRLGFADLRVFVSGHAERFPHHANVMFVGDSSDSVTLMTKPAAAALAEDAQLQALREIWPKRPGWRGRMFMNGYTDASTLPAPMREVPDNGMALFFADGAGRARPLEHSLGLWRHWP